MCVKIHNFFIYKAAPEITHKPINKTVKQGEEVKLTCVANGIPNPFYRWKLNGTLIEQGKNISYGSLLLDSTRIKQEGMYTCEAFNSVGKASANAWVSVYSKLGSVTCCTPDRHLYVTDPVKLDLGVFSPVRGFTSLVLGRC